MYVYIMVCTLVGTLVGAFVVTLVGALAGSAIHILNCTRSNENAALLNK